MFLYPPTGVGRFSDVLPPSIERMGGRVILGSAGRRRSSRAATPRRRAARRRRAHRRREPRVDGAADHAATACSGSRAWTSSTCRRSSTTSRSTSRRKLDYQWTYFGGDEMFSRVTAPEAFLPSTGAAGQERHVRRVHLPAGRRALAASRAPHAGDDRRSRADEDDRCTPARSSGCTSSACPSPIRSTS